MTNRLVCIPLQEHIGSSCHHEDVEGYATNDIQNEIVFAHPEIDFFSVQGSAHN